MKTLSIMSSIVLLFSSIFIGGSGIEAAELPIVRLGCGIGIQNAPWYVGAEKGLFLKNGVDVKVKQFNSGSEIQTALESGGLEMGDASFDVHIVSRRSRLDSRPSR